MRLPTINDKKRLVLMSLSVLLLRAVNILISGGFLAYFAVLYFDKVGSLAAGLNIQIYTEYFIDMVLLKILFLSLHLYGVIVMVIQLGELFNAFQDMSSHTGENALIRPRKKRIEPLTRSKIVRRSLLPHTFKAMTLRPLQSIKAFKDKITIRGRWYEYRVFFREMVEIPSLIYQVYRLTFSTVDISIIMISTIILALDCLVVPLCFARVQNIQVRRASALGMDLLTDMYFAIILPAYIVIPPIMTYQYSSARFTPFLILETTEAMRFTFPDTRSSLYASSLASLFAHASIRTLEDIICTNIIHFAIEPIRNITRKSARPSLKPFISVISTNDNNSIELNNIKLSEAIPLNLSQLNKADDIISETEISSGTLTSSHVPIDKDSKDATKSQAEVNTKEVQNALFHNDDGILKPKINKLSRTHSTTESLKFLLRAQSERIYSYLRLPGTVANIWASAGLILSIGLIFLSILSITQSNACPSGCRTQLYPWWEQDKCYCWIQVANCNDENAHVWNSISNVNEMENALELLSIHTRYLHIKECPYLERLPKTVEKMSKLSSLEISKCSSFTNVQCSFNKFPNLFRLIIKNSPLNEINSEMMVDFHSIIYAHFEDTNIKSFPNDIHKMWYNLQYLTISHNHQLEKIPYNLISIQKLSDLDMTDNLVEFKKIYDFNTYLRKLRLSGMKIQKFYPTYVGGLSKTLRQYSDLSHNNITDLPTFYKLEDLAGLKFGQVHLGGNPICDGHYADQLPLNPSQIMKDIASNVCLRDCQKFCRQFQTNLITCDTDCDNEECYYDNGDCLVDY